MPTYLQEKILKFEKFQQITGNAEISPKEINVIYISSTYEFTGFSPNLRCGILKESW
jgi:hypothetical protein